MVDTVTVTVFDDVFVPWERVFLCGEWRYTGPLANTFVEFHQFTAVSYKLPMCELFIGATQLIAEYPAMKCRGARRNRRSLRRTSLPHGNQ